MDMNWGVVGGGLKKTGIGLGLGLAGVGLGAGALIQHGHLDEERGMQTQNAAYGTGMWLTFGALSIGAAAMIFHKPILSTLNRAVAETMAHTASNVGRAGNTAKWMLSGSGGRTNMGNLLNSIFPNLAGVEEHNIMGIGHGPRAARLSKKFMNSEMDHMIKPGFFREFTGDTQFKGFDKNNPAHAAQMKAHILHDLNGNLAHRLRLNPRIGVAAGVGSALMIAPRVAQAASYNPSPQPSTYFDGVSMRHVNDSGMNQQYADSVRGFSPQQLAGMVLAGI